MRISTRFLLLLLVLVLLSSSIPASAQLFKKAPSRHNVNPTEEDGPELISTGAEPVIRFSVGHQHALSFCVGYLYVSPKSVRYEVLAPAGDRGHSFEIPRSELATAKQWFHMRMIELKPRSGEKYHLMHLRKSTLDEVMQDRLQNIDVLDFAEILQAINAMPEVVAALEKKQAQLAGALASGGDPREAAAQKLKPRPQDMARGGIYRLEDELTFNVLDNVYFDPATGHISLVGHRDKRYAGPRIPYLQHLAALLESQNPEFTLNWTPDSERKVDAFLQHTESPAEIKRTTDEWGTWFDASGRVTRAGRYMLPALGVYPAYNGSFPGSLGVQVAAAEDDQVVVTDVLPGSPADIAGMRRGDVIARTAEGPPLQPVEFMRRVAFAGAGSEFVMTVVRDGSIMRLAPKLAIAPGDPWKHVERNDMAEGLLRAAGRTHSADVAHAIGTASRLQGTPSSKSSLLRLLEALGLKDMWDRGDDEIRRGVVQKEQAVANLMDSMCQRLDSSFNLPGSPVSAAFQASYRRTGNPMAGMEACFEEMDRHSKDVMRRAVEELWLRPGGIQIAPELVETSFGMRPEVTREYRGTRSDSQLARVMFEADYLGKRLMDMPQLKKKLPRYQTGFEFSNLHPSASRNEAAYHMWISIAKIDAAESRDHNTLELRDAKMQFNIREKGIGGRDLPPEPGGYQELLTSLYDDLAVEFPVLHELREAAKLSLVAEWMRARQPRVQLPSQGRALWEAPDVMPGLVYIYLHPHSGGQFDTTVIAMGGIALEPFPNGNVNLRDVVQEDTSVVDLRPSSGSGVSSLTVVPEVYNNTALSAVLNKKIEVPEWHPDGWVARATKGQTRLEAINLRLNDISDNTEQNLELRRKLEEARQIAQQLALTERTINLLTSRNPSRQQEAAKLHDELKKDMKEFEESAFAIVSQHLLDFRGQLRPGQLRMGADVVNQINEKLGGTMSAIEAVNDGGSVKAFNAALENTKAWSEQLQSLASTAGAENIVKYMEPFKKAQEIGDVYNVGKGFLKLELLSEDRIKALEKDVEVDSTIINKHIELQKELSDRLDTILRDPLVKNGTSVQQPSSTP